MQRLPYCLALLWATLLPLAFGAETASFDESDHLAPVDPHPAEWHAHYIEQIRSRFKLESNVFAQMVVLPSFSAEYAVQLHRGKGDEALNLNDARQLVLTYSIADASIWASMPENDRDKKRPQPNVTFTTVEFPKSLAMRIIKLWRRMLLRTRYRDDGNDGLDGTTFEFGISSAHGTVIANSYGEAWSPHERRSPLLFVELGESLIAYCKATPEERAGAAKKIEAKSAQLEKYLDDHAVK